MVRRAGRPGGAMRVVFYDASAGWSGHVRACMAAGQALARRGYEVAFATPEGSALSHAVAGTGGAAFSLEPEAGMRRRVRDLRRALEAHAAHALVVQDSAAHLAAALASRADRRLLLVRRVPAGAPPPDDRLTRLASRLRPATFLYTAPASASELAEAGEPVVVLGLSPMEGGDHEAAPDAPPRLACLAGDEPGWAEPVLRATAMLAERHPDLRLVVQGAPRRRDALRIHAASLGLGKRVEWVQERPGGDAGAALEGASLAWVATDGDAGAFACLDAMRRGVPVFARRTLVAARYVEHGGGGELFARPEPAWMAAAAERLLGAPERRAAMSRAARERVSRDFTEREMAAGYERVLRLAREPAPR